jgi:hypothetical protein
MKKIKPCDTRCDTHHNRSCVRALGHPLDETGHACTSERPRTIWVCLKCRWEQTDPGTTLIHTRDAHGVTDWGETMKLGQYVDWPELREKGIG